MAAAHAQSRGFVGRLIRLSVSLVLLLIVVMAAAWIACRPVTPDAFYRQALPEHAPAGTLVNSERFTRGVPAGGQAWRILYTTSRGGRPARASAVVMTAADSAPDLPIIAWAHGTTGIVGGCAPSLLEKPFDNVPDIEAVMRAGWAYVGTDYPGLGTEGEHSYLVGADAAHAVLDAVRAARQLKDVALSDRVVVWGHSQGGNSALWTGMRARQFAPELNVMGVAALAPASDLKGLVRASKSGMFGKIVSSYLMLAYARAYPDVTIEDYVGLGSRLIVRDIASRCVAGYRSLFSVFESILLPGDGIFARDPTAGPLGARLGENTPNDIIPAPLLVAQGDSDDLVLPVIQNGYVSARCAAGQPIDYRRYAARDHISVVAPDSPLASELVQWTRDRFEVKPARPTCP